MVYILFYQGLNIHTIYSSFFGSFTLGLISHYMARKKREPAIIFMVTGIIPLVPGGLAFDATKNLVLLQFGKAINTMLEVTLIAGAIALGLLFADQISTIKRERLLVINPHLSRLRILFFILYHFFNFSF